MFMENMKGRQRVNAIEALTVKLNNATMQSSCNFITKFDYYRDN